MKKDEMIAMGIKEENIKGFREQYWKDVEVKAKQLAGKGDNKAVERFKKGGRVSPARSKEAAQVAAIVAMLRLIDDPVRLNFILNTVNREHLLQEKEKERKEYAANMEELRQRVNREKKPWRDERPNLPQEAPEEAKPEEITQEDEKAGEIPEAAPEVC